jgi:2'-hydroxyisoflavone reductase
MSEQPRGSATTDGERILVLGGTGWLGAEIAEQATARGARVTCLARGETGSPPAGAELVQSDRRQAHAYERVAGRQWDEVIELSWQPGFVREALAALADSAQHWTYVSSCSVYKRQDERRATESAELHSPTRSAAASASEYGPAKAACEAASLDAVGDRLLRVRPGLIGGPGDPTGRSSHWVLRAAAARTEPMLAPAPADAPTQIIDVRDLASWLLTASGEGLAGAFNAVGPAVSMADWIALSRVVGSHAADVIWTESEWLLQCGIAEFAGEGSLPLWIAEPSLRGFFDRDGTAAEREGLRHRPRVHMLADTLAFEQQRGRGAKVRTGLTLEQEEALLEARGFSAEVHSTSR